MIPQAAIDLLSSAVVAELEVRGAYAVVLRVAGDLPPDRVLDADERRRLELLTDPQDRARYVTAHHALRVVLGTCVGSAPESLAFARAGCPACGRHHGRPVLRDGRGPEFSLSHAARFVAVAISSQPVGVDVEATPPTWTTRSIARSLHANERLLIASRPSPSRPSEFTRLWTRKEAYLKGRGTGLAAGLASCDVTIDPPGWSLVDQAVEDHVVALAVRLRGRPERPADDDGMAGCRRTGLRRADSLGGSDRRRRRFAEVTEVRPA